MVNHLRTLLVNISAANLLEFDVPYCDSSFTGVKVDESIRNTYNMLMSFADSRSVQSREKLVTWLMPFLHDPEFTKFRCMFDTRETHDSNPVIPESVFKFYLGLGKTRLDSVASIVSDPSSVKCFSHVGDVDIDAGLDELRMVYTSSKETARRFSALLFSIALHLDRALNLYKATR